MDPEISKSSVFAIVRVSKHRLKRLGFIFTWRCPTRVERARATQGGESAAGGSSLASPAWRVPKQNNAAEAHDSQRAST